MQFCTDRRAHGSLTQIFLPSCARVTGTTAGNLLNSVHLAFSAQAEPHNLLAKPCTNLHSFYSGQYGLIQRHKTFTSQKRCILYEEPDSHGPSS